MINATQNNTIFIEDLLLDDVSEAEEWISTDWEETDFLAADVTKEEEVVVVLDELSFFDSTEFFFKAETDFDLVALPRDSRADSSVDSGGKYELC